MGSFVAILMLAMPLVSQDEKAEVPPWVVPPKAKQAFLEHHTFHSESMNAYGEKRYADAAAAVRRALEKHPDHAGLNYNYACFATLAGEVDDETFAHLRRSVELRAQFREDARRDDDFESVRDDPRFEQALR